MAGSVFVAIESFGCEVDGNEFNVSKGERVREGHPVLRAQPQNFEPADRHVDYEWETAAESTATTPKRGKA